MNGLQCPVCDEVIPYENEDHQRSLTQLLGGGVSTAVADHTEALLRKHLGEHTLEDFVGALVMADRYIAIVEAERDELAEWKTGVLAKMQQGPIISAAARPRPEEVYGTPPPPMRIPPDQDFGAGYVQPEARRMRVDPDRTLIPHIPIGQRPEGAVGRRT